MLEIITRLVALKNTVKLYHWNIVGSNFNADHPYLDEIAEPIDGFIDELAEKYFMATKREDLSKLFEVYKTESVKYYGEYTNNADEIFKQLKNMIVDLQDLIEEMDSYRGVNNVLDGISSHLLNVLGLIKARLSE